MLKSIRVKIFLTLLLTTMVVTIGMYGFMRFSFERGFMSFVESRQQKHIENVLAALTDYFESHQEWHSLSNDKKKWLDMIWLVNSHRHHQPPPWINEAIMAKDNVWPPKPPEEYGSKPSEGRPPPPDEEKFRIPRLIPLEMRLMLLDADKNLLFGRTELVGQLSLIPIVNKSQAVGFLGVLPGKPLKQIGDIQFMEQQAQALVWITLTMILLSAGLALLIAYGLGKPLKRITMASKALAVGQYNTRLSVDSNDELGQLARDFNDLAAALAQAEQTRQRWVADISHELRTPLAVLRGELEALQDGVRPLCQAAVDSLYGDVMRLSRLAEDLYQLALSDQGALTYRKTLVDPVKLLEYDLDALAKEFQRKSIAVTLDKPIGNIPLFHADPDRLSQLYRNLLANTLHYTDNNGQLCIAVDVHKDRLILTFADSEPGIAAEALPKLFERFYRVDSSRNRSLGGAGLGLAICRNIVEAHNGTITATHSKLGGLQIRVTLTFSI
jgi:two-component system sensor histidine kinase BaeS